MIKQKEKNTINNELTRENHLLIIRGVSDHPLFNNVLNILFIGWVSAIMQVVDTPLRIPVKIDLHQGHNPSYVFLIPGKKYVLPSFPT